jgi:two-component system sensor histidine kinase PhoQ
MSSLSARLLVSVSLLLVLFFGATIVVLDIAFRQAGEQAQEDILDTQLMALIAEAEPNVDGELEMPPDLREPRFGNLGSGLYGALSDESDTPVWTSRSALGLNVPYGQRPAPGAHSLSRVSLADGTPLMALSLHVQWELASGELKPYTFSVAQSMDSFNSQLAAFRRQLFSWFGAIAVIMLISISIVMRGLLKPLRQIESEISDIESGRRQKLSDDFPDELSSVARNMNLLIGSERGRSERYRNTLDNLAIERMNDIVRYQLRKPSSIQGEKFGVVAVSVDRDLDKLVDGLHKVYKGKQLEIDTNVPAEVRFRGDTGDFLELAGNLMDNACKWCESKVALTIEAIGNPESGGMRLIVDDDGPGIPADARDQLLKRGMRLDEKAPGHGIGLAVVKDIATSYGGEVHISDSPLGGARIAVTVNPG